MNLKYLENHYLARVADQYHAEIGNRDPVSNAVTTAIISSISATITNIFQFVIPQGITKITIGTPSFGFLAQNLTLCAFSIVLGVFALGRFNQSMTLAEDRYHEDNKVLAHIEKWGASLHESLKEDIVEIAQLQANIDSKNLEFIKYNLICFMLGLGLIAANAIFVRMSLEILAVSTVCAMIGTLILFAYNLGSHWDDNVINKKRIAALHVHDIIKNLHKINSPTDINKKITLQFSTQNGSIQSSPTVMSHPNGTGYRVVVNN